MAANIKYNGRKESHAQFAALRVIHRAAPSDFWLVLRPATHPDFADELALPSRLAGLRFQVGIEPPVDAGYGLRLTFAEPVCAPLLQGAARV